MEKNYLEKMNLQMYFMVGLFFILPLIGNNCSKLESAVKNNNFSAKNQINSEQNKNYFHLKNFLYR